MKLSLRNILKILSIVTLTASLVLLSSCGKKSDSGDSSIDNTNDANNETVEYLELKEGDKVPDFTADLTSGGTFKLSDNEGKVTVINIWATWCMPCVGEMPAFQMLMDEYGNEIAICAINNCEDKEVVDKFVSENGFTFPIAYDPDYDIGQKFPTDGIPYTVIVDGDGNVAKIYLGAAGAEEQYAEYKNAIDSVMAASKEE